MALIEKNPKNGVWTPNRWQIADNYCGISPYQQNKAQYERDLVSGPADAPALIRCLVCFADTRAQSVKNGPSPFFMRP